jgi:nucleotide-binding universal stress UspA family protein
LHGGGRRFDPGILHYPAALRCWERQGETDLIFTRILAATDGTEVALRGVEAAARMAERDHAELLLLTAVSMPQYVATAAKMDRKGVEAYVERMAQESLRSSVDLLKRMGIGAEVKVVVGPATESIVTEAVSSRADLIVMGLRSRYEPKDLILGSVSSRVAHNVKVPILLVP